MTKGKLDNKQGREVFGVGGAINTKHEGPTKRPAEGVERFDNWAPPPSKRKSPFDFIKEKWERDRKEREAKKAMQQSGAENLG